MKKILTFITMTFMILNGIHACLNGDSKGFKDGSALFLDREGNVPYGHSFNHSIFTDKFIKRFDSLYMATNDLDYLSDKGLVLILQKKYDEAIRLYLEIEKTQPNRYSTASNIGTAFELIGENEKALYWINKSISIDSLSHHKSEWIHSRILEAKIKGSAYYTSDFIIHQNFGNELLPKTSLERTELIKLLTQLFYQLNERVSFVTPKDTIVSNLLFDLGNIAFLIGDYKEANIDYGRAKEYGFENDILDKRILVGKDRLKRLDIEKKNDELRRKYELYLWYTIIIISILTVIFIIIRKLRRRYKNNS